MASTAQALERAGQTRALVRQHLPEDRTLEATVLTDLAAIQQTLGDYATAEATLTHAVALLRGHGGESTPDLAAALHNLGVLLVAQGERDQAESLLWQALEARRVTRGPAHLDFGLCLTSLADLYRTRGNPGAAEPLALQGSTIVKKGAGGDPPRVRRLHGQPGRGVPGAGELRGGRVARPVGPGDPSGCLG